MNSRSLYYYEVAEDTTMSNPNPPWVRILARIKRGVTLTRRSPPCKFSISLASGTGAQIDKAV
jgi:hypothetical protein